MAGWKVHALANCMECGWNDGDRDKALERGRAHNRKTGHVVTAETGHAFRYDRKKRCHFGIFNVPQQKDTP